MAIPGISFLLLVDDPPHNQLNQCVGNVIVTDDSFEAARWFTPARGTEGWIESFQVHCRLIRLHCLQTRHARSYENMRPPHLLDFILLTLLS